MKQIIGYPCSSCEKITNITIIYNTYFTGNLRKIRFKKDCCNKEEIRLFDKKELKHYLKEGGDKCVKNIE